MAPRPARRQCLRVPARLPSSPDTIHHRAPPATPPRRVGPATCSCLLLRAVAFDRCPTLIVVTSTTSWPHRCRSACRLAHCQHSLEFFSREAEKQGHLFELFLPHIISRSCAKPLNARSKIHAPHFFRDRMPI